MMPLTAVLGRFQVLDPQGGRATLLDLAIDMAAGDHPPVSQLLIRWDRALALLPWAAVVAVDCRAHQLRIAAFSAARPVEPAELDACVLLRRDVQDALVLDLVHLQAVRANELWLAHDGPHLVLAAADVGWSAILRRLSRGRLGHWGFRDHIDWAQIEFLRGDPQAARAGRDYHRRVARLRPPQLARLTDALPYLHAAELLTLLPDPIAADTLEVMRPERQVQVFEELDDDQRARLVVLMAPDAAADLLGRLTPAVTQHVLEALPAGPRAQIVELLRYPEDTVGGVMTNDVVVVARDLTVGAARLALREQMRTPDFVSYVYVVDDPTTRRVVGVLSLRDLLVTDEQAAVASVMSPIQEALSPLAPASTATAQIEETHLNAVPVVADDGRLLGIVTIDAALAQFAPAGGRDTTPRIFS